MVSKVLPSPYSPLHSHHNPSHHRHHHDPVTTLLLLLLLLILVLAAPSSGRKSTVPPSVEDLVVWYCKHRYKFGKGVQWGELPALVTSIVKTLCKHIPALAPKLGTFQASSKYVLGFRHRHETEITKRKKEFLDRARAMNANRPLMELEIATRILGMEETDRRNCGEGIAENLPARNKYNCDESGFHNGGEGEAVVCPIKERDCRDVDEEHGEHVSALLLVSGDGWAAEPFFLLKGVKAKKMYLTSEGKLHGVGDKCSFAMTPKANMTTEVRMNDGKGVCFLG